MLKKLLKISLSAGLLVSLMFLGSALQAQTSEPASAQLSSDEKKIVDYIMNEIGKSKAGKPNFGPKTAMAVKKDLGISVTPDMVPRIRTAVVMELKNMEARLMLKEGSKAPGFSLPKLGVGTVSLADLKGKVVVVNFWATWCPPCLKEMPMLNELQAVYKDEGVVLLGLSLDEEGLSVTEPFIKKLGINYDIVEADKKTYQAYGNILTIPHTFVIDRNGIVTKRLVNNQNRETFEAAIKAAL